MNLNSKNNDIYFSGDIHYYHYNLTRGETKWEDLNQTRDFDKVEDMSNHIVYKINQYIKENDIFFFLGDWSFSGIENIWNLRKRINCKNIYFVIGNHDRFIKQNRKLPNCSLKNGIVVDYIKDNQHAKAHDLFKIVENDLNINIDGNEFYLTHYPKYPWKGIGNDVYHLHAHSHAKSDNYKNRLDVGLDNAFKLFSEYKPFKYEEIIEIFNI